MKKRFRVAEHTFAIEATAEQLARLDNYNPFEVADGNPLFVLYVSDEAYRETDEYTKVFVDSSDDDMPRIEVYAAMGNWRFDVSKRKKDLICFHLSVDARFSNATLYIKDTDVRFAIDNAAMLLYAFATADLKTLEMHASVVVKDGFGQLFLGHSGTGKSTHARLWQEAYPDAWLLNDDNPVVRVMSDGEVRVYGSPWSGKTPCYKQAYAPVCGIVKLSQAPQNEITRLRLPEAYACMLSSSSGLKIVPTMMDSLYSTIVRIINTIPVFGLKCLPNPDAAMLCRETLNTIDMTSL